MDEQTTFERENEIPVGNGDEQNFDHDAEIMRVEDCVANLRLIPISFDGDRHWIAEAIALLQSYADDLTAQAERE